MAQAVSSELGLATRLMTAGCEALRHSFPVSPNATDVAVFASRTATSSVTAGPSMGPGNSATRLATTSRDRGYAITASSAAVPVSWR